MAKVIVEKLSKCLAGQALAALALAISACGSSPPSQDASMGSGACSGEALFGLPNAHTGLSDAQCRPTCTCGGAVWTPTAWTPARVAGLRALVLSTPFVPVDSDPYLLPPPAPSPPGTVCAVVREAGAGYHLRTFATEAEAAAAGAIPTHEGACGVCSTLADLAVYAERPDLTEPVRQCGLDFLTGPQEGHLQCLMQLGFTRPCAQVWYWNTLHTRSACGGPCFAALGASYHLPDGSLNACLACDEAESGPVFKAVAGRSRRNTGVPSAMCRPCSEVRRLSHDYGAAR